GTTSVGTAVIAGTSWNLELPAGTIAGGDTTIALRLTAAGAQPVEQDQVFALDDGKPAVTSDSRIYDERHDTIDFASGEAVHSHGGSAIDLGTSGCPDVYK